MSSGNRGKRRISTTESSQFRSSIVFAEPIKKPSSDFHPMTTHVTPIARLRLVATACALLLLFAMIGKARALTKIHTNQGRCYFSFVEGRNGRRYIGTAKYGEYAYLVEYDPVAQQ